MVGQCFDDGLGPDSFDCSGLIAKTISDVRGTDIENWPADMRHVRDMWNANGKPLEEAATPSIGDILVQAYISKGHVIRPGHIGIVVENDSDTLRWLHASPRHSRVLVSNVPKKARILGKLSVES